MSTTTQILFKSPALHSHGKNVDLIQRLQQHAQTLPKDSPLTIAARSDNPSDVQHVPSTPTRQMQPTATIRLISNPFSHIDQSYSAGENGTPQLQPFHLISSLEAPPPVVYSDP